MRQVSLLARSSSSGNALTNSLRARQARTAAGPDGRPSPGLGPDGRPMAGLGPDGRPLAKSSLTRAASAAGFSGGMQGAAEGRGACGVGTGDAVRELQPSADAHSQQQQPAAVAVAMTRADGDGDGARAARQRAVDLSACQAAYGARKHHLIVHRLGPDHYVFTSPSRPMSNRTTPSSGLGRHHLSSKTKVAGVVGRAVSVGASVPWSVQHGGSAVLDAGRGTVLDVDLVDTAIAKLNAAFPHLIPARLKWEAAPPGSQEPLRHVRTVLTCCTTVLMPSRPIGDQCRASSFKVGYAFGGASYARAPSSGTLIATRRAPPAPSHRAAPSTPLIKLQAEPSSPVRVAQGATVAMRQVRSAPLLPRRSPS